MKPVAFVVLGLATHVPAHAEPQGQLLVGAAVPLDGDDNTSGTLDLAAKALWHVDVGSAGLAAHWQPWSRGGNLDGQTIRLLAEGQVVVADDGTLAWVLTAGVGAELVEGLGGSLNSGGGSSWSTEATVEAGICMAFTGWRFPPLLCLAVTAGLTTGDVDAVSHVGLRF